MEHDRGSSGQRATGPRGRGRVGRIAIEDGTIVAVDADDGSGAAADDAPLPRAGFVDVHVHGGGGHDAMGDRAPLDGMARHLLRRGVTGFLPTAVTAPLTDLIDFAERVRDWLPDAPADGAEPLGLQPRGAVPRRRPPGRPRPDPPARSGRRPGRDDLEPLVDGLRLLTIAPELPGALDLIGWFRERGVATSMGHSAATCRGGARRIRGRRHVHDPPVQRDDRRRPPLRPASRSPRCSTTRRTSNSSPTASMSIRRIWPLILRLKPADRLLLVSDAISLAGDGRRPGADRRSRGRGRRATGHSRRDLDPGRVRHRPRRRGPQPRRLGRTVADSGRRGEREPAARSSAIAGSRPDRCRPARRPRRARRRARTSGVSCAADAWVA